MNGWRKNETNENSRTSARRFSGHPAHEYAPSPIKPHHRIVFPVFDLNPGVRRFPTAAVSASSTMLVPSGLMPASQMMPWFQLKLLANDSTDTTTASTSSPRSLNAESSHARTPRSFVVYLLDVLNPSSTRSIYMYTRGGSFVTICSWCTWYTIEVTRFTEVHTRRCVCVTRSDVDGAG